MFLKHWEDWLAAVPGRVSRWYRRTCAPTRARLNDYEARVTSQNGEDGMIEEIFRRLGVVRGSFVEFGVQDGRECNTARLALGAGWSGVVMEGAESYIPALTARFAGVPVRVMQAFITAENVADLFGLAGVPEEFDLLSIDIDGNDYWVWRALHGFRPRVVVIEYNAAHTPPGRWVMRYNPTHTWNGTTYYGASLSSLAALGTELGYALIGTDINGVNAFFVRRDLLCAVVFPEASAELAFHGVKFIGSTGSVGHPIGDGPFEQI
jgi:hypothetical protein